MSLSLSLCYCLVVCSGHSVYILGPAQPDYNWPFAFTVHTRLKLFPEAEHPWCHSAALCVFTVQEEASTIGASFPITSLVILHFFCYCLCIQKPDVSYHWQCWHEHEHEYQISQYSEFDTGRVRVGIRLYFEWSTFPMKTYGICRHNSGLGVFFGHVCSSFGIRTVCLLACAMGVIVWRL